MISGKEKMPNATAAPWSGQCAFRCRALMNLPHKSSFPREVCRLEIILNQSGLKAAYKFNANHFRMAPLAFRKRVFHYFL